MPQVLSTFVTLNVRKDSKFISIFAMKYALYAYEIIMLIKQ